MNTANIAPFVTNLERSIYCLKNLPEEVAAVLFAYYSRSSGSLRESLARLVAAEGGPLIAAPPTGEESALAKAKEAARAFHEKWVVGYGHSSVAEHAVAHVAVEDCSILASKAIEDNRLASFTEKSTRYVWFDPESFHTPAELDDFPALREEYQATARHLLRTYITMSEQVLARVRGEWPLTEENSPEQTRAQTTPGQARPLSQRWESQTKAKACDICRYLLPAGTRTNLGMTFNGRAAEHLIRKLLAHPLAECRAIGVAVKAEVQQILPTLVKYAERNEHLAGREGRVAEAVKKICGDELATAVEEADHSFAPKVMCVSYPADAVGDLAAAILYEHAGQDAAAVRRQAGKLSKENQLALIEAYLAGRGPHDPPGRALERVSFTFDILVDYGAFRDIQRHRMCTQTHQPLTCGHGYALPPELERYGLAAAFHAAMQRAKETHGRMSWEVGAAVASYIVPLAFRKRTLFTWNLRELWHFITLRSGRQGHGSYRLAAQACWRELARVCSELARHVPVDMNEYELGRSGKETVREEEKPKSRISPQRHKDTKKAPIN